MAGLGDILLRGAGPLASALSGHQRLKLQKAQLKLQEEAFKSQQELQQRQQEGLQQAGEALLGGLARTAPTPAPGVSPPPGAGQPRPGAAVSPQGAAPPTGMVPPAGIGPPQPVAPAPPVTPPTPRPTGARGQEAQQLTMERLAQATVGFAQSGNANLAQQTLAGLLNIPSQRAEARQNARLAQTADAAFGFLARKGQALQQTSPEMATRFQGAALLARTGKIQEAMKMVFPNIKEPANAFQAFLRQGDSPEEALEKANTIGKQPTKLEYARRAARGDKEAKAILGIMGDAAGRQGFEIDFDKDGKVTGISRGRTGKLPSSVISNGLQTIQSTRASLRNIGMVRELLEEDPGAASLGGRLRLQTQNFVSNLTSIFEPGSQIAQELQGRFSTEGASQLDMLMTSLVADVALAKQGGGRLSDQDFKTFARALGVGKLTSAADILTRLDRLEDVLRGTYEDTTALLGAGGIEIPPLEPKEGERLPQLEVTPGAKPGEPKEPLKGQSKGPETPAEEALPKRRKRGEAPAAQLSPQGVVIWERLRGLGMTDEAIQKRLEKELGKRFQAPPRGENPPELGFTPPAVGAPATR